jgi:hypothetical protein
MQWSAMDQLSVVSTRTEMALWLGVPLSAWYGNFNVMRICLSSPSCRGLFTPRYSLPSSVVRQRFNNSSILSSWLLSAGPNESRAYHEVCARKNDSAEQKQKIQGRYIYKCQKEGENWTKMR